eukprot:TRINITY_DN16090_c0_g1_i1.p1 TRINITY_DN16090_c0_g1~~TRINITY_DN16090_c0_g1_i1.p1  ORF type:complete len:777 (+),score=232.28 TRINITY_DN16090_c0_g1_i1:127-2457(+)
MAYETDTEEEQRATEQRLLVLRKMMQEHLTAAAGDLEREDTASPHGDAEGPQDSGKTPRYDVVSRVEHELLGEELKRVKAEAATAREALEKTEKELRALKEENEKLATKVRRRSVADTIAGLAKKESLTGASKFNHQKAVIMQDIRAKRERKGMRLRHADAMAQQEAALMRHEDGYLRMMRPATNNRGEAEASQPVWMGGANGRSFREYIERQEVILSCSNDEYVGAKASTSSFATKLGELQALVRELLGELKAKADDTLCTLERAVWPQMGRQEQPRAAARAAYGKLARQGMLKSKMMLADGLRKVNDFALAFVAEEKAVREGWVAEALKRVELGKAVAGTQTDEDRGNTELELQLIAKVEELKSQHKATKDRFAKEARAHKQQVDNLTLNLTYLQEKTMTLLTAIYANLHLVYKHRYRWIARHTDPLKAFTRSKAAKLPFHHADFNNALGDVIGEHVAQLKKLGDYFTRSDLFGVDMASVDKEAKKDGPGSPASRRRSSVSSAKMKAVSSFVRSAKKVGSVHKSEDTARGQEASPAVGGWEEEAPAGRRTSGLGFANLNISCSNMLQDVEESLAVAGEEDVWVYQFPREETAPSAASRGSPVSCLRSKRPPRPEDASDVSPKLGPKPPDSSGELTLNDSLTYASGLSPRQKVARTFCGSPASRLRTRPSGVDASDLSLSSLVVDGGSVNGAALQPVAFRAASDSGLSPAAADRSVSPSARKAGELLMYPVRASSLKGFVPLGGHAVPARMSPVKSPTGRKQSSHSHERPVARSS